jgi:hypothetical protein
MAGGFGGRFVDELNSAGCGASYALSAAATFPRVFENPRAFLAQWCLCARGGGRAMRRALADEQDQQAPSLL